MSLLTIDTPGKQWFQCGECGLKLFLNSGSDLGSACPRCGTVWDEVLYRFASGENKRGVKEETGQ